MSTKKLERTVIEGGRYNHNKFERRLSNKEQRATERAYMADLIKDPEHFEEEILEERDPVHKGFSDKLSPMYRWLEAQAGRKWADVRSEVFQKFDTRTTAGRHITFDHLLSSIVDTESGWDDRGRIACNLQSWSSRYPSFYVDSCGILQQNQIRDRSWRHYKVSEAELAEVGKWLQGRMVGLKGGVLYWFSNPDGIWEAKWSKEYEKTKYGLREGSFILRYYAKVPGEYKEKVMGLLGYFEEVKRTGLHWEWIEKPAGFKQRGALTQDEIKHFKSFPQGAQDEVLFYTKNR